MLCSEYWRTEQSDPACLWHICRLAVCLLTLLSGFLFWPIQWKESLQFRYSSWNSEAARRTDTLCANKTKGLCKCEHVQTEYKSTIIFFFLNANFFLRRLNRLNSNSLRSLQCFDSTNNVKAQLSLPCHLMSAPLCDSSANRAALCAAKTSQGCGSH